MTIGRKYYEKTDKQKLQKYPYRIKQEIEKSENFDVTIKLISVLIAMLVINGDKKLIVEGLNQISLDLNKPQPKVCIDFLQEQLKFYGKKIIALILYVKFTLKNNQENEKNSMSEKVLERMAEFAKGVQKLSFVSILIEHDKKEYIFLYQPNPSKHRLKIELTDGFDFWTDEFDFEKFEVIRQLSGLDGSYSSYFDMMHRAIINRQHEIILEPSGKQFNIKLFFVVNKSISLRQNFNLGKPLFFEDSKEFHCIFQMFLFDVYKAKDQEIAKVQSRNKQRQSNNSQDRRETQRQSQRIIYSDEDEEEVKPIKKIC